MNPLDVLKSIQPSDINEDETFTFELYDDGSFFIGVTNANGSLSSLTGVYHPNVVCEGDYTCKYCGRTLDFES